MITSTGQWQNTKRKIRSHRVSLRGAVADAPASGSVNYANMIAENGRHVIVTKPGRGVSLTATSLGAAEGFLFRMQGEDRESLDRSWETPFWIPMSPNGTFGRRLATDRE